MEGWLTELCLLKLNFGLGLGGEKKAKLGNCLLQLFEIWIYYLGSIVIVSCEMLLEPLLLNDGIGTMKSGWL
jgi:hypothetical protein